jgi:hypothetical protein
VIYRCCDEKRKAAVLGNPTRNGIDYLEVLGFDAQPLGLAPQTILLVRCLKAAPSTLTPDNILITGGESITNIKATFVTPASSPPAAMTAAQQSYFSSLANAVNVLMIGVSAPGDFLPYTLRLVNFATGAIEDSFEGTEVLAGFDPQLAEVEFSFKVECPPFFDCKPVTECSPTLPPPPQINYLAKDYGSFRSVILDRLSQLLPTWGGTSEADIGIALAELLAYVGDSLSYKQDAIATEAYLQTARSRISLRRHALLVDYHVHDGCNARTWIHMEVSVPVVLDGTKTQFCTLVPGAPSKLTGNERQALAAGVVIFEGMQEASLLQEHNQMSFYTWGDENCCLPKGATEATLLGTLEKLQPGDVLIFKEIVGPQTGNPADADVRHRCAVRLTAVTTHDAQGNLLVDPLFEDVTGAAITSVGQKATPVTEIQWAEPDALPFPVCISSKYIDSQQTEKVVPKVSIVLGNNLLADHGVRLTGIDLDRVPRPKLFRPPNPAADRCHPTAAVAVPVRYQPVMPDSPITQVVTLQVAGSPVTSGVVHLATNKYVTLDDSNGLVSLTVQAASPLTWPNFFGVLAQKNTSNPANFDLSIVYNPLSGAAGMSTPPVLETFTDLSLVPGDPNYVLPKINAVSRFITIPAAPPGAVPAAYPGVPDMLTAGGTTNLKDTGGTTYLTVQPTNPAGWPPLFGVLTQGDITDPLKFNLLVVYAPSSGNGVLVPVVVEEFDGLSLAIIVATPIASNLVKVRSFEDEPNLKLSAYDLLHYDASQATPAMKLTSSLNGGTTDWTPEPDLLGDAADDTHFVLEVEYDGTARVRFGDGVNGMRPKSDSKFSASYRVGNGTAGNIGADTLILCTDPRIDLSTNPLAAVGGTNPETTDQIRRRAPQAFMTQERAVTMADYERVTEMNGQVQHAVATLRWTGSWYTVFITAERKGEGRLTTALRKQLKRNINRYRLAGQDIELEAPQYVSLQIDLTICVDPDYFSADVEGALMRVLGCGMLPDGTKGVFYPGNFTFGQTIYLSPIYAAARKVPGVQSVTATTFQAQSSPPTPIYLSKGEMPLGPFQIARLENDRSLPDHGQLTLNMQGGK